MIAPTDVRYIKLGEKGRWEKSCIEEDGTIRLGYESNQHHECLDRNWGLVRAFWLNERRGRQGAATSDLTQIQSFYTLPSTALWITIHNRMIHWCFAEDKVIELPDGSRTRKAIGGWSCETEKGEKLHLANVDGRVTKVQGFQGTICNVEQSQYLIRKINGEEQPEVRIARASFSNLRNTAAELIKGLWWHDFELLADLIFSRQGWQRVSVLGKTERDIDLDLVSPITNSRLFVQVKSNASFKMLQESIAAFRASGIYSEMYFVVHTADARLLGHKEAGVTVLGLEKIAELAINCGLMAWLIKKHE
ncbi:MAG: hypothetical protein WCI85_13950 [Comamonadaceae bacterium]